jgi:hypothetical protein
MVGARRSALKALALRFRWSLRSHVTVGEREPSLSGGLCKDPPIQNPVLHLVVDRCMLSVGLKVERKIPVEKIKKPMLAYQGNN